jgi:hypothetical protein
LPRSSGDANRNASLCGADFVAAEHVQEESHQRISAKTVSIIPSLSFDNFFYTQGYIMYGVFASLIFISLILVVTMLDQKRKWNSKTMTTRNKFKLYFFYVEATPKEMLRDTIRHISSTFQQMKTLEQMLLMPLAFWIGTFGAFMFGIFTNVS